LIRGHGIAQAGHRIAPRLRQAVVSGYHVVENAR
jgi:hypothetical protein